MKLPNLDGPRCPSRGRRLSAQSQAPGWRRKSHLLHCLGFRAEQWQKLAEALKWLAAYNEVSRSVQTEHGWKKVVEGEIETPVGRSVEIRTVWIVDHGQSSPRLVTAYPLVPEKDDDQGTRPHRADRTGSGGRTRAG